MKQQGEHDSPYQIPKLIHFVWAGGEKLIEDPGIIAVSEWCKKNPTCTVILWVDYHSYKPGEDHLISEYSDRFSQHGVSIISDPSLKSDSEHCILLQDIGSFRDEIFVSEIGQLLPNYGASSDILRLRILYEYGGCYFDQDVYQNPNCPLQESDVFKQRERHCIILEHRPQRPTPAKLIPSYESGDSVKRHSTELEKKSSSPRKEESPREHSIGSDDAVESVSLDEVIESLPPDDTKEPSHPQQVSESTDDTYDRFIKLVFDELGNDAIITTKQNPLIKLMLDKILSNYTLNPTQCDQIIFECYGGLNRRDLTIYRTGPGIQQSIFNNIQQFTLQDGNLILHCYPTNDQSSEASAELETGIEIDFEPMRSKTRELTIYPQANDQNWLKVLLTKSEDSFACRKAILDRIKFEARHFKILRLDDHLEHMAASMKISKDSTVFSETAKQLIEDISQLNLDKNTLVKVTFAFPDTIEFCKIHHLNSILTLEPFEFCMAVQLMTPLNRITNQLRRLEQNQNDSNQSITLYIRNFPKDRLITVKVEFEIILQTLSLLALPQNIVELPINSQHELCRLVTAHQDTLTYGAKLLSHLEESLFNRVEMLKTYIEQHQHLLGNRSTQQQPKSSTSEGLSDDENKSGKHTYGK